MLALPTVKINSKAQQLVLNNDILFSYLAAQSTSLDYPHPNKGSYPYGRFRITRLT